MNSRLSSVGSKYSTISKVSNNGGKYGQRRDMLNSGCRPRKGGMLSEKEFSPIVLVMVYVAYHIG
jgi:hypothetical protein